MIEKILTTVLAKPGYDLVKKLFQDNRSALKISYRRALDATKQWYAAEYGDRYGSKNNRFFDYQVVDTELEKMIFYIPKPSIEVIERFSKERQITTPPEVILLFIETLQQEMSKIPECEAVLAERDNLMQVRSIEQSSADTATHTGESVNLQKELLYSFKKAFPPSGSAEGDAYQELDWRKLLDAFKRRQLDKIMIKQIGEGKGGPEMLDLAGAFFEQDVSSRIILFSSSTRMDAKRREKIQQFAQQESVWQSYLWRYMQEYRFQEKWQDRQDSKMDTAQFVQIADKLVSLAENKPARLSGKQFAQLVAEAASGLDMTNEQIIEVLSWHFAGKIERMPVLEALKPPCSALLIGDAGSGKTTAMRKMCLDLFKDLAAGNGNALPIPVFIRLDTIYEYLKPEQSIEQAVKALFDYVSDHWQKDLFQKDDLCKAGLDNCPQPIQLVLDGLDEVGSVTVRRNLAKTVNHLSQNGHYHIIVTSRPAAIDQSLSELFELRNYRLMELAGKQPAAFVQQFFRIYNGDDNIAGDQDAAAFKSALADTEAAQEFAANPLYLTIMMLMHKKHEVLPKRRIDLYEEFINMLLSQRQSEPVHGKIGVKPVFKVDVPGKRPKEWSDTTYCKLLRQIAYDTHGDEKDSVSITKQRVLGAIRANRLMRQVEEKNEQDLAREFIDFCDERLGLLVARGPYYGFSHRSIQEYFAAVRIERFGKDEISQFWHDKALKRPDRWHEVVRLAFCLIREEDYCFEFLEQQWPKEIQASDNPQAIEMIATSLFDLQGFYPNYDGEIFDLYEQVKKALIDRRCGSSDNPSLFLACGDALGLLNEPPIGIGDPPVVALGAAQPFMMGDEQGDDDEKPVHPVKLSDFWIDKYPVTNKLFAEFAQKGGYDDPDNWVDPQGRFAFDGLKYLEQNKWVEPRFWRDERFGKKRPLAPVVGVSWFEAMAFCRWWAKNFGPAWAESQGLDGEIITRLPTEAEWEFAAHGYDKKRFPWGNEEPAGQKTVRANIANSFGRTTTVGSFPDGAASAAGLMDMSGNVWEWCFDWFDEKFYNASPEQDPVNISGKDHRVLRGGSWNYDRFDARCADRLGYHPDDRNNYVGFRCVRTLK